MGCTGLGVLLDNITDVGAGTVCIKICHNMIIHYHSFFLESASYNVYFLIMRLFQFVNLNLYPSIIYYYDNDELNSL